MTTETSNHISTIAATVDGMERYYRLAKHQAWDVRQLSWGEISPVPEGRSGSPEKTARRHAMWRSVVTQQLQADMLAVECSTRLLRESGDYDARLYYTTMTQDEARHLEAWLRLSHDVGGTCEPDPYLEKMGKLILKMDNLEEMVWLFQVCFEGLVIPRFHQIAAAAPNTILAEICRKLSIDDGIHHASGVCYERHLLQDMTQKTREGIRQATAIMWPLYMQHLMWRPRERAWASQLMHRRDAEMITMQVNEVQRMGNEFGIDLEDVTTL